VLFSGDSVAVRPILVVGNPVLRQKTMKVKRVDAALNQLIEDMIDTMRAAPGVGLAAPQVGVPLRVAVIEVEGTVTVIINPKIVKTEGSYVPDEGCLSVPGYWGKTKRAERVVVKARDRNWKEIRLKGENLFGQALQHEIDHLDGTLYLDRLDTLDSLQRVEPRRAHEPGDSEAVGEQESEQTPDVAAQRA
jgi:peptide deformylase